MDTRPIGTEVDLIRQKEVSRSVTNGFISFYALEAYLVNLELPSKLLSFCSDVLGGSLIVSKLFQVPLFVSFGTRPKLSGDHFLTIIAVQ